MFTGLIQEQSKVVSRTEKSGGFELSILKPISWTDLTDGESISVNGVCLTLTKHSTAEMAFFVGTETLLKTNFAALQPTLPVNLERSLRASDRLGGHLVSGHVDGIACVVFAETRGECFFIKLRLPSELSKWVMPKGSIAIEGVSLTVNEIDRREGLVTVLLIPETIQRTNLGALVSGSSVNIECDSMVKTVVEHLNALKNEGSYELNP